MSDRIGRTGIIMKTNRKTAHTLLLTLFVCMLLSALRTDSSTAYAATRKVRYVAHRGLSASAPENTLAALRLAAQMPGFYGVEFDIWESRVEKNPPLLLVMHDQNTKRMCGKSADIRTLTSADLSEYPIRNGKNIQQYTGQTIPTAKQALDTIWNHSAGAVPVIELKHRLSSRALKYLIRLIGKHKAVIISFDFKAVANASKRIHRKKLSRKIKTMYLMSSLSPGQYSSLARRLKKAKIDAISLRYTAVRKKTVKTFHKAGIEVCVWTVPDKKRARKYKRMGVDYITCNSALFE